jgi:hypothetical protein
MAMIIFDFILFTVLLSVTIWLIPGMLGGVITTIALRREKIPLGIQDIISIGGQWMFASFLGGLVGFGLLLLISMLIPVQETMIPTLLVTYLCFGAGAAVVGVRGARIVLNVLNYS